MIAEKIKHAASRLGGLSHQMEPEAWAEVRLIRNELLDAAEAAGHLEHFKPLTIESSQADTYKKGAAHGPEKIN